MTGRKPGIYSCTLENEIFSDFAMFIVQGLLSDYLHNNVYGTASHYSGLPQLT